MAKIIDVSFRLQFDAEVSEEEVLWAIQRALQTKEFGLKGNYFDLTVKKIENDAINQKHIGQA